MDVTPSARACMRARACKLILRAHRQARLGGYFTARFTWHFCDIEVQQWSVERRDVSRGPLAIQAGLRALRGERIADGLAEGAAVETRVAAEVLRDWLVFRYIRREVLPQHNVGDIVNADLVTLTKVFPALAAKGEVVALDTRVATPLVRAYGQCLAPALGELIGGPITLLRPLMMNRSHVFDSELTASGKGQRKAAWLTNEAADALAMLVNAHWAHVRGPVSRRDVLSAFHRLLAKNPEFQENAAAVGNAALSSRRVRATRKSRGRGA